MKIEITPAHIIKGTEGSYTGCPIALAVAEAKPEEPSENLKQYATVNQKCIRIIQRRIRQKSETNIFYKMEEELTQWIKKYDSGKKPGPITIELSINPETGRGNARIVRRTVAFVPSPYPPDKPREPEKSLFLV